MIIIEFENLQLQLIDESDLELIREWRNAPHVAEYMDYQSTISEAEQKIWFGSIQNKQYLYFKILVNETPIGVLNLKNINWDTKEAEAGIFVGREDFRGTITPILSVFILMKTVFDCMAFERLFAKIANSNEHAIEFNEEMGYQLSSSLNEGFSQYICHRSDFYSPQSSISKIQDLFNKNGQIRIYVDEVSAWVLPFLQEKGHHFLVIQN